MWHGVAPGVTAQWPQPCRWGSSSSSGSSLRPSSLRSARQAPLLHNLSSCKLNSRQSHLVAAGVLVLALGAGSDHKAVMGKGRHVVCVCSAV